MTSQESQKSPPPAADRDTEHLRPGSSQSCLCHRAPERTHPQAGSRQERVSKGLQVGVFEQGGSAQMIGSYAKCLRYAWEPMTRRMRPRSGGRIEAQQLGAGRNLRDHLRPPPIP